MRNTANFKFGQIVLVSFPCTHQRGGKQRPAIIISSAWRQNEAIVLVQKVIELCVKFITSSMNHECIRVTQFDPDG